MGRETTPQLAARVQGLNRELEAENLRLHTELAAEKEKAEGVEGADKYLRQLQDERLALALKTFSTRAVYHRLARALNVNEEAGELAREERHAVDDDAFDEVKAKDAVGDIVIALAGYCTAVGYDLQECVEETWAELRKRWESGRTAGDR